MADKSVRIFDTENQEYIDIKVTDNGDGTYSQDSSSTVEGRTSDSAVATDTTGTISGKLRGIVKLLAALTRGSGNVDSNTLRVITAADGSLDTNLGTTTDAAISTDTTGSLSGKIRGLVKIFADTWDDSLHALQISDVNKRPGDDPDLDLVKVEEQYDYATEVSTDGVLINGAGFCHILYVNCTTAGTLVIRDSVTAGGGTIIRTLTVPAAGIYSLLMDVKVGTGLYADYGTMVGNVGASKR